MTCSFAVQLAEGAQPGAGARRRAAARDHAARPQPKGVP
jgi:hypothetical protein